MNRLAAHAAATALAAVVAMMIGGCAPDRPAPPTDEILYGGKREAPVVAHLAAGPVRLKFQDGELRYLRVGSKEIIRRVYFAVRDGRWDTVMPEFTRLDVRKGSDGFRIDLAATCRNDIADYRWEGRIVGTGDGTITFAVSGQAGKPFTSYRVGLCVLFGAESLVGQKYELIGRDGASTAGAFPRLIAPKLLAQKFAGLRYTTAAGVGIAVRLAEGHFGMEDQRTFGDSSYKAFSGVAYGYPRVPAGVRGGQTLVLEVKGAERGPAPAEGPIAIAVGGAVKGAAVPLLVTPDASVKAASFAHYNRSRAKYAAAERIVLPYNPAAHMPDDDTFMENVPAVRDQVRTIHSFAPKARFRVDPITIDSPYPRPGPDRRNKGLFAAAWCMRMVKYLALAGVDEAAFALGPGPADAAQRAMGPYAGRPVLATDVAPHADVDALALQGTGGRVVWLINKTDRRRHVALGRLRGAGEVHIRRLNATTLAGSGFGRSEPLAVKSGTLTLVLDPFEVCIVTESEPPARAEDQMP